MSERLAQSLFAMTALIPLCQHSELQTIAYFGDKGARRKGVHLLPILDLDFNKILLRTNWPQRKSISTIIKSLVNYLFHCHNNEFLVQAI